MPIRREKLFFLESQMSEIRLIELTKNAEKLMRKSLEAKAGEQVLIVLDTESDILIATALASAARTLGAEPTITLMPRQEKMGVTSIGKQATNAADIVVGITKVSIAHSPAIHKALLKEKKISD